MGQLRKRGGVWWIRYYRNGRRYEESAKTDKKGKAAEILALQWRQIDVSRSALVTAEAQLEALRRGTRGGR